MDVRGGIRLRRKGAALALLCAAQFVDVFDVNAVIVALHSIGVDLGFSQAGLQWVVSVYVLFFAGFLLLSGRLADLWGRRRTFVAGLALFAGASLFCGLSGSPELLVGSRALQGLGAAITAPAALSIITIIFAEGPERDHAVAAWTAVAAGGGAAGLLLGGLITDVLGWEWIFFVNLPVGAAGIVLSYVLLPESRDFSASRGLDLLGAGTVTAGLVLLVLGLTRIEEAGFGSPPTIATLGLAVALFGAFVFVERRAADPLVPLGLFRLRGLVGPALIAFALTAATAPVSVLVTLYLQNTLGYSASFAGLTGLPFSLCVIAGSVLGGRIPSRISGRATMSLGLAVVAASAVVTAGITAESGVGYVLAGAALSGLGLGCASVASTARGTSAVEEGNRGLASGLMNTSAQVGTALGLATLISLAAARTAALSGGTESGAEAVVAGYRFAFLVAAGVASLGVVVAQYFLRKPKSPASDRRALDRVNKHA
ncbi:MAG: MFS transporter [Actinomycetota bacterium]|nr:MFS transporter [Actinomycetota bacterium]